MRRVLITTSFIGLIWLVLLPAKGLAQYRFDSWTTDDGLPQNTVSAILQTRDGYLWLATAGGLVRFDGLRFTVFDKSNTKGLLVGDMFQCVFECADGAGALSAYREHRPEWVLMDIDLPEVDGISATRQIIAAYPQARVMIVTNYDDAGLHEAARSAGACEYVVKQNLIEIRRILAAARCQKASME
jgi:CheY-like chemotaxis protein